jgi:hypothetical protein
MNAVQPSAVQIPAERTQQILEVILPMSYYDSQKAWVAQAMKQQNLLMTSAVIVKTVISGKVSKALEALGNDLQVSVPAVASAALKPIFQPQFYQTAPGGFVLLPGTDYNLLDCRLCLEGEEIIIGLRCSVIPGNSAQAKVDMVSNMDWATVSALLKTHGFIYNAKPGTAVMLPGDHVLIIKNSCTEKPVHGLRWQLMGSAARQLDTIAWLQAVTTSFPDLATSLPGQLLTMLSGIATAAAEQ